MGRLRTGVVIVVFGAVLTSVVAARIARTEPLHMSHAAAIVLALNATDEVEATNVAGCGVERWAVKTMSDPDARQVRLAATPTTIAALRNQPAPPALGPTRLAPVELRTYRVTGKLVAFKREGDSDIHLVIADPKTGGTMIAEFPLTSCVARATTAVRARMSAARAALVSTCGPPSSSRFTALSGTATVTGVGFWDYRHGQTDVAPNGIELHPVLGFTGSCRAIGRPPAPRPVHGKCARSYPDECIPPPPPDLDCADIPYRNFRVLWNVPHPDPHHFDGNRDGIGCTS